jgi:tripartite-type tricarboxylate transporter receptor subunit TctC
VTGELFRIAAGIDMIHVPYKGGAPATADLIGGQVMLMFNNPVSALPQIKAGKLRALAVTTAKRSPIAPELPTVIEQGYPGFEASTWFALIGPAGLPKDVVARLHADVVKALQMKDVRERLAAQGIDPLGTTPEELATIMKADGEKWGKLIRATGIKAD